MMMKGSSLYKLTTKGLGLIQSGFNLLLTYLLTTSVSCWHWTRILATTCRQNYPPIIALENYTRKTWESICAAITVEVISKPCPVGPPSDSSLIQAAALPVLRLNSVAMDESLMVADGESPVYQPGECISSSNYNQPDDCDSGLVFMDPDENELSSDDAGSTEVPSGKSSDVSSDGHDISDKEAKVIRQVELMFSDEQLANDAFLLSRTRRRSHGFVSLRLVAALRQVKQITRDFPTVLTSLRKSTKLEINEEGTKIRRITPLTAYLKSLPTRGTKEKENKSNSFNGASSDSAQDDHRALSRHGHKQSNGYIRNQQPSISSTGSSGSSRHGDIPGQEQLVNLNMMVYAPPGDMPQNIRRRRGRGPLPMTSVMSATGEHQNFRAPQMEGKQNNQKRNSMLLCPNTPKPTQDDPNFQVKPKSNGYCQGEDVGNRDPNPLAVVGTSLWLQLRMESSRAASDGSSSIVVSGIVRQPRGPDGTRGFASGFRQGSSRM